MTGSSASKNLIAVVIGAVILFGAISVIPIVIMRQHRRRAAQRHADELQHLQVNGSMQQVTVRRWLDQQQTTTMSSTATSDNLERFAGESCPICLTSLLAQPSQSDSASSLSGSTIQYPIPTLVPNQPTQPETAHISPSQSSHPTLHLPPDLDTCRSPILRTNNDDDDGHTRPPSLTRCPDSLSSMNTLQTRSGSLSVSVSVSNNHHPSLSSDSDPEQGTGAGAGAGADAASSLSGVLILTRCNHAFHSTCLASWFQYRQYRCPICADVLLAE